MGINFSQIEQLEAGTASPALKSAVKVIRNPVAHCSKTQPSSRSV